MLTVDHFNSGMACTSLWHPLIDILSTGLIFWCRYVFPPHVIANTPISIHKVTGQCMLLRFQSRRILGCITAIPFSTSDIVKGIRCKALLSWQVWSCCWDCRKRLPQRLKPTFYQRKQQWRIWTIVSWIMAGWDTLLNHLILLIPTYFSFYISICSYKACITLQIQELLELLVRLMDCAVSCEKTQKMRELVSVEPRRYKHLVTQTQASCL